MGRAAILVRAPVGREVALQPELGQAGQRAVGLGVVHELAHTRLPPPVREEALLEVEEAVLATTRSAAEVELLEPAVLTPARRLKEDEVRGRGLPATLARAGHVVVEPRRGGEAERGRRKLVVEASLDEHDPL